MCRTAADTASDRAERATRPAVATGGCGLGGTFSLSAALISGCEIPGIGFIDADTVEALLTVVPTDIGRALLDARTGTLMESVDHRLPATQDAHRLRHHPRRHLPDVGLRPPRHPCDLDHARPWPTGPTTPTNLGGLCRRHHRLKQRRRWTYQLAPDGTATWTSPIRHQAHHPARPRRPPTTTAAPAHAEPSGHQSESSQPSRRHRSDRVAAVLTESQ